MEHGEGVKSSQSRETANEPKRTLAKGGYRPMRTRNFGGYRQKWSSLYTINQTYLFCTSEFYVYDILSCYQAPFP